MKILKIIGYFSLIVLSIVGISSLSKCLEKTFFQSYVVMGDIAEEEGMTELRHKNIEATVINVNKYIKFGFRYDSYCMDIEFKGNDGESYVLSTTDYYGSLYKKASYLHMDESVKLEVSYGQILNITTY